LIFVTIRYKYKIVGLNSRLDALQASILSFKLSLLDEFTQKRQSAAVSYNKKLCDLDWLQTPVNQSHSNHVYHQYSVVLSTQINRDKFQKYLASYEIPSMIYYPIPLHQQEAYKKYANKSLPISEKVAKQIISLPMHPELDLEQINFICDIIKKYV